MLCDKITSFSFLKEDKVAFNEKNQMDTLKYLSIIIKICFIYVKKNQASTHTSLSQTTNFRLFQTERVSRRQFQTL